jgi:secondary thiamine-phosphate synthase enzyme
MKMAVETHTISLETLGNGDIRDITAQVKDCIKNSQLSQGIATVFTPSATSAITSLEYEPGCVQDLQRVFDEIIPPDREYAHNQRWGDGNGHSHARAALLKSSFTIPFMNQEMTLGTWQSLVLVDFDNRARKRKLVVQLLGE